MSTVSFDLPSVAKAFTLGAAPLLTGGPAFAVFNSSPADQADVWFVDSGAPVGGSTRVTTEPDGTWNYYPIFSPDKSRILFKRDSSTDDTSLYVMNADGSGVTLLHLQITDKPEWLGNDAIVFLIPGGGSFDVDMKKINVDGTGLTTLLTKSGGFFGYNPSPDGTKIAYAANDGAATVLGIVDADGSNDTTLVSGIQDAGGNALSPVWRLDGSEIMFSNGAGVDTIAPDGSGQTTHVTTLPNCFWYPCGMAEDRFFYTDTSTSTNWRIGQVVFGVGASIAYSGRLSQAVQRGVAVYDVDQGRVFSILHDSVAPGGVDTVFSLLPDGTDYRMHFEADESGSPNFQNLQFR